MSGRKFHVELRTDEARSKQLIRFPVDLVVEHRTPVGQVQTVEPTNRLHLPQRAADSYLPPLSARGSGRGEGHCWDADLCWAREHTYEGSRRPGRHRSDSATGLPQLRDRMQDRSTRGGADFLHDVHATGIVGAHYSPLSASRQRYGREEDGRCFRIVRFTGLDPAIRGDLLTQHTRLPDTGRTGNSGLSRD